MSNGGAQEGRLLGTLKSVGQFLGVVGGGGAGFAGLAFGIGYLATKHHDAMMGMPTTTTDNTSYVRTGALFFTQSLHDLVGSIATAGSFTLWGSVVGVPVAVILLLWVSEWVKRTWNPAWLRWVPLMAASVALLFVALAYLPRQLAPLDIGNQNLLFEQREVAGYAADVNALLRSERGEQQLHRLYGRQWLTVLGLALGAFLLYRWRGARPSDPTQTAKDAAGAVVPPTSVPLATIDRVLHPALYAVIAALLVSMPANYGVLAMSTSLPCGVHLYRAPRGAELTPMGEPGYLVSDLSSEAAVIAILRWDSERRSYFVDLHPRADMRQIEVRGCPVRNPVNRVPGAGTGVPGTPPK